MTTVFLHHYYVPKVDYGHTYLTNFHEEFDNADHVGTDAILETYNRLLITGLDFGMICTVRNHRINNILNSVCCTWIFLKNRTNI